MPAYISVPVGRALNSPGRRLDEATLSYFDGRFGHDFSGVSVHTDGVAADAARALGATAFTVGTHVVFGANQYAPWSQTGHALLTHELTHVVQQSHAGDRPLAWPAPNVELYEREARRASRAIVSDRALGSISSRAEPMIQRQAEGAAEAGGAEGGSASFSERAIEQAAIRSAAVMRGSLPIAIPETIMAALIAAQVSFLLQGYRRLVAQGDAWRFVRRVAELADAGTAVSFYGRYVWGVLKGLVSPITGLIELAILGVRFQNAATQWILQQAVRSPEQTTEARALGVDFERFVAAAQSAFTGLRQRDKLLAFAGAVFGAAAAAGQELERRIVRSARQKGREAADSLVSSLLTTPLPALAETAGEVVGTVVIELVLLLFTDGIGNLITKLGEFARTLRMSRGAADFARIAARVGHVVRELEEMLGVLLSKTVLRPIMPILEAFQPLVQRMRRFVGRLFNVGEQAGQRAAAAGARTAERAVVSPPVPSPNRAPPVSGPPSGAHPSPPRAAARGATAEGTGEAFKYEYHPPTAPPSVTQGRTARAPQPNEPVPRAADAATPSTSRRGGFESDDIARSLREEAEGTATASRSTSDWDEINAAPSDRLVANEEIADAPARFPGDRFDPATTEEELAELTQQLFPQYAYNPRMRGRVVLFNGRISESGARRGGSTVPDLYLRGARRRPPISLEAKNVFVGTPEEYEQFIVDTVNQAGRRLRALPRTAQQHVLIDLRGQDVTAPFADGLRRDLAARSGGILRPDRIHFLPPSLN